MYWNARRDEFMKVQKSLESAYDPYVYMKGEK